MITDISLVVSPQDASNKHFLRQLVAEKLDVNQTEITFCEIIKKSIDARKADIKISLTLKIAVNEPFQFPKLNREAYIKDVSHKPSIIIIGAGPAGLFAALKCIEMNCRPIVLERGENVHQRKRDIAQIIRNGQLNTESNYCFGEGGAGTFSDGKLYTRSKKRGNIENILKIFAAHGANEDILIDAHPHIGSDKLPQIIENIRNTIIESGGEVHFKSKVTAINKENAKIVGVTVNNNVELHTHTVILATGHSARDIYEILHNNGIAIEQKPFALGVRVEHPQEIIDRIQYHGKKYLPYLPAASYALVSQENNRGVYSFCMCPGGIIVPAATETGTIVVNGMSNSQRNSPFANSGIVVEIKEEDTKNYETFGPLAGMQFQKEIEKMAQLNGGRNLQAPAQRLTDFVKGTISTDLPECSYLAGVISSPLHFWLPEHISKRLQNGFINFNKKMKGFLSSEAIIMGVESRTSSPIRIPRDKDNFQHTKIKGLFPCGEGAGYAGGIASSAIDGQKCAEQACKQLQ